MSEVRRTGNSTSLGDAIQDQPASARRDSSDDNLTGLSPRVVSRGWNGLRFVQLPRERDFISLDLSGERDGLLPSSLRHLKCTVPASMRASKLSTAPARGQFVTAPVSELALTSNTTVHPVVRSCPHHFNMAGQFTTSVMGAGFESCVDRFTRNRPSEPTS